MKAGDIIKAFYTGNISLEHYGAEIEVRDDFSTSDDIYEIRFVGDKKWLQNIPGNHWQLKKPTAIEFLIFKETTIFMPKRYKNIFGLGDKRMINNDFFDNGKAVINKTTRSAFYYSFSSDAAIVDEVGIDNYRYCFDWEIKRLDEAIKNSTDKEIRSFRI